jgi:hypothetical protein
MFLNFKQAALLPLEGIFNQWLGFHLANMALETEISASIVSL